MTMYESLIAEAIERLESDDDLFIRCIEELDNWNGFADGFRAYPMWKLDDLFGDMKLSDFLDRLAPGFNNRDEYMIDSIYGLDSTDDVADHYRSNVDEGELIDNLIDRYDDIDLEYIDSDFSKLIGYIIEERVAA